MARRFGQPKKLTYVGLDNLRECYSDSEKDVRGIQHSSVHNDIHQLADHTTPNVGLTCNFTITKPRVKILQGGGQDARPSALQFCIPYCVLQTQIQYSLQIAMNYC